jgi:hypothetical protein
VATALVAITTPQARTSGRFMAGIGITAYGPVRTSGL